MPSDARLRGPFTLQTVTAKTALRLLLECNVGVAIEAMAKPALGADWLGSLILA